LVLSLLFAMARTPNSLNAPLLLVLLFHSLPPEGSPGASRRTISTRLNLRAPLLEPPMSIVAGIVILHIFVDLCKSVVVHRRPHKSISIGRLESHNGSSC
jgi:hypothetical protein